MWAGLKGFATGAVEEDWDLGNVVICSNRERSEETEALKPNKRSQSIC